jgi:hypothetical protein
LAIVLEIKAGPLAGKKLQVARSKALLVGRALDRAQFAVPHDNHMSGLHFAVECGLNGCRVIDKKSTNGTFLNGAKIQEAMLASGDEIKSGQTVFLVRIVSDDQLPAVSSGTQPPAVAAPKETPPSSAAPVRPAAVVPASPIVPTHSRPSSPADRVGPPSAPRPAPPSMSSVSAPTPAASAPASAPAFSIGGWRFGNIPVGWQIQEGLGIQQDVKDAFPSNIGAMEEPLGPGITLPQYVEAQTKMFREYLREPKIDAALPPVIPGASETVALEVRYSTKEGQSIYYQRVYVRNGTTVGVLTLTTLERDLASVHPAYDSVLSAVSFSGKP